MEVTVFDPDYDQDGAYARELVGSLVTGLAPVLRQAQPPAAPPIPLPSAPPEAIADPAPAVTRGPRRPSRASRGATGRGA
jgi:arginase